jgi:hypothetical protein
MVSGMRNMLTASSDTIRSIDVDPSWEVNINDIEHFDEAGTKRCFSDGVGKLSQALLDKIYEQSESLAAKKPTVFQIRYGGAKGMVIMAVLVSSIGADVWADLP